MSNTLVLQHIGQVNGVDAYGPVDAEAVKLIDGQKFIVCDMKASKSKRTALQNRAIHKYFSIIAEALNDAGIDMKMAMAKLSKNTKIPWTASAIKERLWRPVQMSTYGHESTAKLTTEQVSIVYESLNLVTSEKLGVGVNFPSYLHQLEDIHDGESLRTPKS